MRCSSNESARSAVRECEGSAERSRWPPTADDSLGTPPAPGGLASSARCCSGAELLVIGVGYRHLTRMSPSQAPSRSISSSICEISVVPTSTVMCVTISPSARCVHESTTRPSHQMVGPALPLRSKSPISGRSSTYHDRCFQPIVVESSPGNSATTPESSGASKSSRHRPIALEHIHHVEFDLGQKSSWYRRVRDRVDPTDQLGTKCRHQTAVVCASGERDDRVASRRSCAGVWCVGADCAVVEGGVDVVLRQRRSRLQHQVRGARVGGMQQRECLGCLVDRAGVAASCAQLLTCDEEAPPKLLVDLRTHGSLRCEGQPTHVLSSRIMATRSL